MQRISFHCDECEAEGIIKLTSDYDDWVIEVCPCCGAPLDLDDDEE